MDSKVAKIVKELRERRAWPQEQLAQVAEVSVRTIQRIESGLPVRLDTLQAIASAFEIDVNHLTQAKDKGASASDGLMVPFMVRISSGTELCNTIARAEAWEFSHDDLSGETEVELVSGLFQELYEWGMVWDDVEPGEKVNIGYRYNGTLGDLDKHGLWIFALTRPKEFKAGENSVALNVCALRVVRSTNPTIVRFQPSKEALATKA